MNERSFSEFHVILKTYSKCKTKSILSPDTQRVFGKDKNRLRNMKLHPDSTKKVINFVNNEKTFEKFQLLCSNYKSQDQ